MIGKLITRFRKTGFNNTFTYFIVRFYFVRFLAFVLAKLFGEQKKYDLSKSIFPHLNPDHIRKNLAEESLHTGLTLSESHLNKILNYANNTPCYEGFGSHSHAFKIDNKSKMEETLEKKIILATYDFNEYPCKTIQSIAEDPLFCQVAQSFLGCAPKKIDPRLWWSFATSTTTENRLSDNQTIYYHYDLESYRFLYISFYILNTDIHSGAHVAVKGSHKRKKLSFLFSSANQTDTVIESFYKPENIVLLEGKAGTGFFEDSFCYHKALIPKNRDRLLFQIRYSL